MALDSAIRMLNTPSASWVINAAIHSYLGQMSYQDSNWLFIIINDELPFKKKLIAEAVYAGMVARYADVPAISRCRTLEEEISDAVEASFYKDPMSQFEFDCTFRAHIQNVPTYKKTSIARFGAIYQHISAACMNNLFWGENNCLKSIL